MATNNPTTAAASAPAATAQAVTVGGVAYTISSENTAFAGDFAKRQVAMPWWGKKDVAVAFATEFAKQPGKTNVGATPFFAFQTGIDVAYAYWNKAKNKAEYGQRRVATFPNKYLFAVATVAPPPPAAAVAPPAPAPAVAAPAPPPEMKRVTVGGQQYELVTVVGRFSEHREKLQRDPWYYNAGLAEELARELKATLGIANKFQYNQYLSPGFANQSKILSPRHPATYKDHDDYRVSIACWVATSAEAGGHVQNFETFVDHTGNCIWATLKAAP